MENNNKRPSSPNGRPISPSYITKRRASHKDALRLTLFLSDLEDDVDAIHRLAKEGDLIQLKDYISPAVSDHEASLLNLNNNVNLQTALHISLESGHTDVAKYLIECGAELELTDKIGRTPFLYSARYGNFEILKLLLERGADPKVVDGFNETALHLSVVHAYTGI